MEWHHLHPCGPSKGDQRHAASLRIIIFYSFMLKVGGNVGRENASIL